MRCKILVTVLAGLALAACETTSEDAGSASGSGTGSAAGTGSSSGSSSVASRPLSGPEAGSQADLVTNVGDRVFFSLDSYSLSTDARATLEKQMQWLRQNQGVRVVIEGHADERGTREYNIAFGERRATAVRDYLVALGTDPNRIQTVSFGKERPVDPSSTESAWQKNRRGVMVVAR